MKTLPKIYPDRGVVADRFTAFANRLMDEAAALDSALALQQEHLGANPRQFKINPASGVRRIKELISAGEECFELAHDVTRPEDCLTTWRVPTVPITPGWDLLGQQSHTFLFDIGHPVRCSVWKKGNA